MTEVFADAAYYIALLHQRDQFHQAAWDYSLQSTSRIVTTQWVLAELGAALCDTRLRGTVEKFIRRALLDEGTTVVTDFAPWFESGLDLYAQRPDKDWSLTDCISFSVMEARGIREALTGDHHFEQAGYVALLAGKA